jgi:hypothetical protein
MREMDVGVDAEQKQREQNRVGYQKEKADEHQLL